MRYLVAVFAIIAVGFGVYQISIPKKPQRYAEFDGFFEECKAWVESVPSNSDVSEKRPFNVEEIGTGSIEMITDEETGYGKVCMISMFFDKNDHPELFSDGAGVFERWASNLSASGLRTATTRREYGFATAHHQCDDAEPRLKAWYEIRDLETSGETTERFLEIVGGNALLRFYREEPGRIDPTASLQGEPLC